MAKRELDSLNDIKFLNTNKINGGICMKKLSLLDIALAIFWSLEFLRFAFGNYQPSNLTVGFVFFFVAFYFVHQCFKSR